jgi:macrolide transport system ATP-binding/permease protein
MAERVTTPTLPLIVLEDVTKRYTFGDGSLCVLDAISLSVHAGEFVAIMGASGPASRR